MPLFSYPGFPSMISQPSLTGFLLSRTVQYTTTSRPSETSPPLLAKVSAKFSLALLRCYHRPLLAMGEHDLDLTSRILLHLERHLIFHLLKFLQEYRLYPDDGINKAKIDLLNQSNMIDYANKSLCRTEDVSQDVPQMMDRRVKVVGKLWSLEEAALPLVSFLQNAMLIQELRPKKHYNIQMLNDCYQVRGISRSEKFNDGGTL